MVLKISMHFQSLSSGLSRILNVKMADIYIL